MRRKTHQSILRRRLHPFTARVTCKQRFVLPVLALLTCLYVSSLFLVHHRIERSVSTTDNDDDDDDDDDDNHVDERLPDFVFMPPYYPPPYELRNDEKLPEWASKVLHLRTQVPPEKRVCFVHVGKSAGSSLGCSLGFYEGYCGNETTNNIPQGLLPRFTTNVFHDWANDCPSLTGYYLFSIRNPFERVRSAYVYDRPNEANMMQDGENLQNDKKALYHDCPFWTLNDLAERGLEQKGNASAVCKDRAYKAIRGIDRFGYHLYYNYNHYYAETPKDAKVAVIRTEYLVDDWNSIEVLLGGEPNAVTALPRQNSAKYKGEADKYPSDQSRSLICHALCKEIQVYKTLLQKAINLSPKQVQASMDDLSNSCPIEARAQNCQE